MTQSVNNVIIATPDGGGKPEYWTSLTRFVDAHPDISYQYLVRNKLPVHYKGWSIERHPLNICHCNENHPKTSP